MGCAAVPEGRLDSGFRGRGTRQQTGTRKEDPGKPYWDRFLRSWNASEAGFKIKREFLLAGTGTLKLAVRISKSIGIPETHSRNGHIGVRNAVTLPAGWLESASPLNESESMVICGISLTV